MASSVTELVAAREAKGLSTGDIAAQLKLAPRQVAALERGDWAALPGLTFVRGALRAYGRMVGVAVDGLLATLDEGAQAAELRPSTSLDAPMPSGSMLGFGSGGRGSKTAWLILGAVLLLALALFFGRDTDFSTMPSLLSGTRTAPVPAPGSDVPAGRPGVEQIPTLPQSRPALTQPASASAASPVSPIASTPPASAGAPILSPAVAPPPALPASSTPDASAATAPGQSGSVRLQFERESWVEIKQADGRVLLYGQQKAGSEAKLPLGTELSLLIGNAEHVRVERNGAPVDIKSLARQGVARLKLNP